MTLIIVTTTAILTALISVSDMRSRVMTGFHDRSGPQFYLRSGAPNSKLETMFRKFLNFIKRIFGFSTNNLDESFDRAQRQSEEKEPWK
jgi:hypothetical protein